MRENSPDSRLINMLVHLLLLDVLSGFGKLEDQALLLLQVRGSLDGREVAFLLEELNGNGGGADEVLFGVPAHWVLGYDVLLDALADDEIVQLAANDAVGGNQMLEIKETSLHVH